MICKKKKLKFLAEIDGIIDDHIINGTLNKFCFYDWLKDHEVGIYVRSIIDKLTEILIEYDTVLKGEDEELCEGYSHLTKRILRKRVISFTTLIEEAERYRDGVRKTRKPRKKTFSAERQTKYIQYKKEDKSLMVTSINPIKILGANELYLYNTKYKKITRLCAADEKGLNVYRTAITNFNGESHSYLTGTKSKIILTELLNGGKVSKLRVIERLKPAPKLQTRINKETLLLGAY